VSGFCVFFNKGAFIWQKFPKFVLGFLLLASVNFFNKGQITNLGQSLALAPSAYFCRCRAEQLPRNEEAGAASVHRGSGEVVIAAITLALVLAANRLVKL
jgi:hypothetical protein